MVNSKKLRIASLVIAFSVVGISIQANITLDQVNIAKVQHKQNVMPVAIIGAGPAGLSAAVYTARSGLPTYVFTNDAPGGHLMDIKQIENWPALPKTSGEDIAKKLQDQALSFGAQMVNDGVASVNFDVYPFEIKTTNDETVYALSVIIATGFMQEKLDIPGAQKYWGNGIGLCTICDAPFAAGQDVVVVGDDDFAAERVIQLAEFANNVIMVTRKKKLSVNATTIGDLNRLKNAELIVGHEVTEVEGDGSRVTGVRLRNLEAGSERTIPVSTVYLNSVYKPDSAFLKGQIPMDGEGYILRQPDSQQTLIPSIFAAGAVTNKPNKAGPSAGFGMAAAVELIEFMHKTVGFNSEVSKDLEQLYYKSPQKRKMSSSDQVTSRTQLAEVFKKKPITVLFAYLPMCPYCRAMYPDMLDAVHDFGDVVTLVKLNASESNDLTQNLTFDSVPTTFIYRDGVLVHTIRGRANKLAISKVLSSIAEQVKSDKEAAK
ncbi:MAG: FAD-dependent oxidoreductase [Candidatus Babeliales bacterium]